MATADDMMVVNHSASVVDLMIVIVPAKRVVDVLFFREDGNIVCEEREGHLFPRLPFRSEAKLLIVCDVVSLMAGCRTSNPT